jgi:ADP-heptose:LPS heptosyltransferase
MMSERVDLKAEHILLCLRYGIGDLTMELPVLEELRRALPASRITALGAEPAMELLETAHLADRFISYRRWGISDWYSGGDDQTARQVRQWLHQEQFDAAFDAWHTPPVVRNEIYRACENCFDHHQAAETRVLVRGQSGIEAIKEGILCGWGLTIDPSRVPGLTPIRAELELADMLLSVLPSRSKVIGVSIAASSSVKAWPEQNFQKLINELSINDNCSFVLLADSGSSNRCRELMQNLALPERVLLVCNLHLRKVAALLSRCHAYVGVDSGLMHVAAAVGTPPVAVFGPTDPDVYLPRWLNSAAAVVPVPCPHRKLASFGRPACVVAGQCLTGQHCIHQVTADFVAGLIRQTTEVLQSNKR